MGPAPECVSRRVLLVCVLACLLQPTLVLAQLGGPVLSIHGTGHYTFYCCDYHAWPSLNFTGTGPATISLSTTVSGATGSVSLHMQGTDVNQEIGDIGVFVRGNPGDRYAVTWTCTGSASASGGVPHVNTPGVFFFGCGDLGGQGNFSHAHTESGTMTGTVNVATPGDFFQVADFGHWIELADNGVNTADWAVTFSVQLSRTGDADADGVADAADRCPDTPYGTAVDANGCSADQRDTDGDGVSDSLDECPDTPPGTPVDATGCPPDHAPALATLFPSLNQLGPEGIVDDPAALRTGGSPMNRIAADGTTRLLLRLQGTPSSSLTVTVVNDGISTSDAGGVASPADGTFAASVTVDTDADGFGYAVYRAPHSTDVRLRRVVISVAEADLVTSRRVAIEPPPVVLVHGMWDFPSAWTDSHFKDYLTGKGFRVTLADYHQVHANDFFNARGGRLLDDYLYTAVHTALSNARGSGVAATQVDIVGHSMGGLVSRALLTRGSCQRVGDSVSNPPCTNDVTNHYEGWINRLITIDTPHLGSPFATLLTLNRNRTITIIGVPTMTLARWMEIFHRPILLGAVEALQPGSLSLRSLADTCAVWVPGHALTGSWQDDQFAYAIAGLLVFAAAGQRLDVDDVMGSGLNDLVVPVTSQEGGNSQHQLFYGTVHSESYSRRWFRTNAAFGALSNPQIQEATADVLFSAQVSGCFPRVPFHPPGNVPDPVTSSVLDTRLDAPTAPTTGPRRAAAVATQAIALTSPAANSHISLAPGAWLHLQVQVTGAVRPRLVFLPDGDMASWPDGSTTFDVPISPTWRLGAHQIGVLADEPATGESFGALVPVVVVSAAPPTALEAPSALEFTPVAPSSRRLPIVGLFTWNAETVRRDLNDVGAALQVTAGDASAIEIRADGVIVPRHTGMATVTSTYAGLTAATVVSVLCADVCEAGADADLDGLLDDWEMAEGLGTAADPLAAGAQDDNDEDGISNATEQQLGTHAGTGPYHRYLAEGATGTFFDTRLALLNPGETPTTATLRFQTEAGRMISHLVDLPAHARRTVMAKTIAGLESANFSTVVESASQVVVDRTMSWDASGYGSHAESAVMAPSTMWYLAEGSTSGDFALFYLLQNPNPMPTVATVRYLLPFGEPVTKTYTLPAGSRTTLAIDSEDPRLASTDVSAAITSRAPIVVERAMYRGVGSQVFAAGHGSAGVTMPSTHWFLAEGATGPFFDCFILLANPGQMAAEVTIDYLLSDGRTYTKVYTVPAESRSTIWVDAEVIPAGSGVMPLENVAVSSTIESNVPIVVERTMWWPSPALTPAYWTESHNSPGATETGVRWALAEGELGGAHSAETYVLIANTSAFDGLARVTLYFEDDTSVTRDIALPQRSRVNVNISVDMPEAVGRRFGVTVESVGASPAQIIVERAMYTSVSGVTWAAGTNALATKLQ